MVSTDSERFAFGENWEGFLSVIDEQRIVEAERSLAEMLGPDCLTGSSFLDIGCGSGLFSLAALRLGATRVHSLDYDEHSVRATEQLRERYARDSRQWSIERGSVLDREYMVGLRQWDVVYSWGVLHHTGDMRQALENASLPVGTDGRLFIAIYNDQGRMSRIWTQIKRIYNRLPAPVRKPYAIVVMLPLELRSALWSLVTLRPQRYWRRWTQYKRSRGMSHWHDLLDWVGGYPFEVATPEEIFDFYRQRGFTLCRLTTQSGGIGCNEYVFVRRAQATVGEALRPDGDEREREAPAR